MTAEPHPPFEPLAPVRLLTIEEYAALGETEPGYTELVEGRLLMSPSPTADHNTAVGELFVQLRTQVPDDLEVILDIDVDLQLAPRGQPGFSRRPDLVVVRRGARQRVRDEGGLLRASEVVIAVEVLSPGSQRTDRVTKRGEYADARIGHYWVVDLEEPTSLLACHLAGDFGYRDDGEVTGVFTAAEPFGVRLDLNRLL